MAVKKAVKKALRKTVKKTSKKKTKCSKPSKKKKTTNKKNSTHSSSTSTETATSQEKENITPYDSNDEPASSPSSTAISCDDTHSDDVCQGILDHLEMSYRPYSANELVLHFKRTVKRGAVMDALARLVCEGRLVSKCYNKTAIYVYNYDVGVEEDSRDVHNEMARIRTDIARLKKAISECMRYPSDDELSKEIDRLRMVRASNAEKMAEMKALGVDRDEYLRMKKRHGELAGMRKERMRVLRGIVDGLCDGMGKKRREIVEETGISDEVIMRTADH